MLDYSPLWETMKKRNISQYQLLKVIDNKTLDSLKKNGNGCTLNDIVTFTDT